MTARVGRRLVRVGLGLSPQLSVWPWKPREAMEALAAASPVPVDLLSVSDWAFRRRVCADMSARVPVCVCPCLGVAGFVTVWPYISVHVCVCGGGGEGGGLMRTHRRARARTHAHSHTHTHPRARAFTGVVVLSVQYKGLLCSVQVCGMRARALWAVGGGSVCARACSRESRPPIYPGGRVGCDRGFWTGARRASHPRSHANRSRPRVTSMSHVHESHPRSRALLVTPLSHVRESHPLGHIPESRRFDRVL